MNNLIFEDMMSGPVVVEVVLINRVIVICKSKILLHSPLYIKEMLNQLKEDKTKELAMQISAVVKSITAYHESFSAIGEKSTSWQDVSQPSKNFVDLKGNAWIELKG
jgi:hypothetical protein